MLPFFKVFALLTRIFTRPVLMHIKSYHKSNKDLAKSVMARPFIALGNWQYHTSMLINRKLFRVETDSDMFVKPLNVEIALETGMELFYEIAVYSLVIGICIYEIRKYTIEGQISKEKDKEKLKRIERKLDTWMDKQRDQEVELKELKNKIDRSNLNMLMGNSLVYRVFWESQINNKTSS